MKQVHFTLQGKGGVGKSLVASLIAQYLLKCGEPVEVIDADPVNPTLYGYDGLKAMRLDLMEGNTIVEEKFDALTLRIFDEDSNFVIDNGASSFVALNNYMIENNIASMIADHGKQVVIHTVIAGGSALDETLTGFADIVEQMPAQVQIVVWLNEHFGKIEGGGKSFYEMKIYTDNEDRVQGVIRLEKQSQTFASAMEKMLTRKLTFAEINMSPDFDVMQKSRLFRIKQDIYQRIESVL
ncbi:MAG TPA: P-loop NTPase [Chryseosolibacter sp.]|jgi:CobQ/CobB/MinD/ParA nucleotide binding domain.